MKRRRIEKRGGYVWSGGQDKCRKSAGEEKKSSRERNIQVILDKPDSREVPPAARVMIEKSEARWGKERNDGQRVSGSE